MTGAAAGSGSSALVAELYGIVGSRHVLTRLSHVQPYSTEYRGGRAPVVAVVRPASLVEQWRVLRACVRAGVVVIVQAANTGLTGGSTPDGSYDRGVVVVNTLRISGIHVRRVGAQVVCLSGTTLYDLESRLSGFDREPHSVIGSTCIGATIIGGVCNNSGGALVQRGPAYTEYALFAQIDERGQVVLKNHLGIRLVGDPEAMLTAVEKGHFSDDDLCDSGAASARDYARTVRNIDATTPARFNADPARLFEASGSAGKVMVFAVRLDTFPKVPDPVTFYVGTNAASDLATLRRRILGDLSALPVSAEYIHCDAFDIAERYGKDVFLAIRYLGARRLPRLFAIRNRLDAIARQARWLPSTLSDRMLQALSGLFPSHLPLRMKAFRNRYVHHLLIKTGAQDVAEMRSLLRSIFPNERGDLFECTPAESAAAFQHRFAVAGAAVRYRAMHADTVGDILALDIALPRNATDWFERLPSELKGSVDKALYYGHFLCHVFHQDYILAKDADPAAIKRKMLAVLDARGVEYPAEHNVGHAYMAKPALVDHYRMLDPSNRMNPGIGATSRSANWT